MLRGRLCQIRQEIGISVNVSLAVLEGEVERGETLETPLNSHIVVSHFADAFERLQVRNDAKLRTTNVASKAFDCSENAASFQVDPSPVPLGIEGSAADARHEPH